MLSYKGYILKFDVCMSSSEIPELINDEMTVFNELEFWDNDSLAVFASDSTPRITINVSGVEDAVALPVTEIVCSEGSYFSSQCVINWSSHRIKEGIWCKEIWYSNRILPEITGKRPKWPHCTAES